MLNHLIWFLESAVDEDKGEQCQYSPGSSFFIQGIIALREQIKVVGDAWWKQSTERCRAFSAVAMQLLHNLGALFYRWIVMVPVTCVGNRGLKEYVLIRPTTMMGKTVNVTTLYVEWMKEVKIDLRIHSRRYGDTFPPILQNFPAHLIAPKLGRGNTSNVTDRQASRNEPRQGRTGVNSYMHPSTLTAPCRPSGTVPQRPRQASEQALRRRRLGLNPKGPKPNRPVITILHRFPC
jgi:hypothetical protein